MGDPEKTVLFVRECLNIDKKIDASVRFTCVLMYSHVFLFWLNTFVFTIVCLLSYFLLHHKILCLQWEEAVEGPDVLKLGKEYIESAEEFERHLKENTYPDESGAAGGY